MLEFVRAALLIAAVLLAWSPVSFAQSSNQYQPNVAYDLSATVTNGTSTSAMIDLSGTSLVGIFVPSTFDGTTITFQASSTPTGTFVTVQDGNGNTLTVTAAASTYVPVSNVANLAGARFLKIITGTTQTTTDTVFTLATRPL